MTDEQRARAECLALNSHAEHGLSWERAAHALAQNYIALVDAMRSDAPAIQTGPHPGQTPHH